jgi:hypothetical protein
MAGFAYWQYTPRRDVVLPDGRHLDVVSVQRIVSLVAPTRERVDNQNRLVVRYWSDKQGVEQMGVEARDVEALFYPVAAANHVDVLLVRPSRPVLSRTFPVITISRNVFFSRDSAGVWHELHPGH